MGVEERGGRGVGGGWIGMIIFDSHAEGVVRNTGDFGDGVYRGGAVQGTEFGAK